VGLPYPVEYRRGVCLPEAALWLDPGERRELAVVSHAHGDHVARHDAVICTQATYRILTHRMGPRIEGRLLAHGEEMPIGEAVVSLHAAGHVLGSSQVLVQHRGVRVLYSGDIRLRTPYSCEPLQPVEADVLVVEATFGHPHYRFPPTAEVVAQVVRFCTEALATQRTPVLLAYSLGKAQELMAALRDSDLRVVVHPVVHAIAHLYRELGVELPHAACLDTEGEWKGGAVVIVPPHLRESPAVLRLGPRRSAALTGWAVDPGTTARLGCDTGFPLSDHCDFDDLLAYVEATGARRVLTVFGFATELAHQLRRRGLDASALHVPEQLSFALA